MYVNPFFAGVLATIGVELIVLLILFFVCAFKAARRSDDEKH